MKVLKQDWTSPRGSERTSLSRDLDDLNKTKSEEVSEEEYLDPVGEPLEITIPDDSALAELVECDGTVFLNRNELDIVFNSPEYQ